MVLVKICKLLIRRSSDRRFRPILAPKSRFSAACLAPDLPVLSGTAAKAGFYLQPIGTTKVVP